MANSENQTDGKLENDSANQTDAKFLKDSANQTDKKTIKRFGISNDRRSVQTLPVLPQKKHSICSQTEEVHFVESAVQTDFVLPSPIIHFKGFNRENNHKEGVAFTANIVSVLFHPTEEECPIEETRTEEKLAHIVFSPTSNKNK
uniref:MSP domain-containing protein n=1 Tax=Meloidogyne hapla TaxID=6305 RepID=A0A1I8B8L3_MELHA